MHSRESALHAHVVSFSSIQRLGVVVVLDHRIPDQLVLEDTFTGNLVQSP